MIPESLAQVPANVVIIVLGCIAAAAIINAGALWLTAPTNKQGRKQITPKRFAAITTMLGIGFAMPLLAAFQPPIGPIAATAMITLYTIPAFLMLGRAKSKRGKHPTATPQNGTKEQEHDNAQQN